jgi:hypothetical protein
VAIGLAEDWAAKELARVLAGLKDLVEEAPEGLPFLGVLAAKVYGMLVEDSVEEVLVVFVAWNQSSNLGTVQARKTWSASDWLLVTDLRPCRDQSHRQETGKDKKFCLW